MDEFSAVSRRLPIWALYERARSLGLAVQVSAQSWHGLAPDEADRYRIVSAAEGGIWLLRTPHPEPVTELAGQRRVVVTTRRLIGYPRWSRAGSSEVREVPVADPALIRALDVGQAAYLYRGAVTFVQVSRLVGQPAALGPAPVTAEASGPGSADLATSPGRSAAPSFSAQAQPGAPGLPGGPGRPGEPGARPGAAALPDVAGQSGAPGLPDVSAVLDAAFGPEPERVARPARAATVAPGRRP